MNTQICLTEKPLPLLLNLKDRKAGEKGIKKNGREGEGKDTEKKVFIYGTSNVS